MVEITELLTVDGADGGGTVQIGGATVTLDAAQLTGLRSAWVNAMTAGEPIEHTIDAGDAVLSVAGHPAIYDIDVTIRPADGNDITVPLTSGCCHHFGIVIAHLAAGRPADSGQQSIDRLTVHDLRVSTIADDDGDRHPILAVWVDAVEGITTAAGRRGMAMYPTRIDGRLQVLIALRTPHNLNHVLLPPRPVEAANMWQAGLFVDLIPGPAPTVQQWLDGTATLHEPYYFEAPYSAGLIEAWTHTTPAELVPMADLDVQQNVP